MAKVPLLYWLGIRLLHLTDDVARYPPTLPGCAADAYYYPHCWYSPLTVTVIVTADLTAMPV